MPPRRSNQRAAPASRRGNPDRPARQERTEVTTPPQDPPDDDEILPDGEGTEAWHAPPGKMSGANPRYQTGSDYDAVDDGDVQPVSDEEFEEPKSEELVGDKELPASFSKDRDIYGEDDPLPEDDEFAPVDNAALLKDATRIERPEATPQRTGETKIAPLGDADDDEPSAASSADATRAGPPLKLEAIAGPDAGRIRNFRGVRMVIGRTAGCDWKLSDPSASRKHCELVVGDGGVLLRDLGSGNGTKVNGQKVNEKKLEHGDEIAVGKTVIRFIDEVAAFRKAREEEEAKEKEAAEQAAAAAKSEAEEAGEADGDPAGPVPDGPADGDEVDPQKNLATAKQGVRAIPTRRPAPAGGFDVKQSWNALEPKQRYAIFGGIGAVLLLFVLLVATGGKEAPPPPDPKIAKAEALMEKAQALVKDEKYEEAAKAASEADRLVPGSDSEGLAERAKQEAQALRTYDEAKKLHAEGRFDEAKVMLGRAAFVSQKGTELKKSLQQEIDSGMLQWLKGQADSAIQSRDLANARGIISRLPVAHQREYEVKLQAVADELAAEEAAAQQKGKKVAAQKKQIASAQRKEYVERAFDAVARKFAAGEFQRAALECDRVADQHRGDDAIRSRSAELKRLIPAFAKTFEEGQRKYKAGALESAARPLKKARELYLQIGFEGALGKVIDEELASAALAAATSSYAREDYPSAAQYYKETLKLSPNEERARDGIARVNKRAEELYLQAYMIRDREPKDAISKLKVVLQVAEGGPLHQKAKDLLASLQ